MLKNFKSKLIINFLFLLAISSCSIIINAQEYKPFEENNLWGFKDDSGKVRIKPQYQYARKFVEKYAVIALNNKLGAIDKDNKLIIPIRYDFVENIGHEFFIFGYRAKYLGEYNLGVITSNKKVIIPPKFYYIDYRNGYFKVTKQSYTVTGTMDGMDVRGVNDQYGIIDSLGKVKLKSIYSLIRILDNKYIVIAKELNGNRALFDADFHQLTEYKYMVIGEFYEGLAKVRIGNFYGYVDLKGHDEIPCEYNMNYRFIDSLAIARKNEKVGLINTKNQVVLNFKYQSILIPFKNQVLAFDSLKWGIINLQEKTLLKFEYDKAVSEYKGITALGKDNKWQIWDYRNMRLFPQKYDEIQLIESDVETILETGIIKAKKYNQSIAYARIGADWGVVNDKAEILIPIQFKLDDLYGMINKKFLKSVL